MWSINENCVKHKVLTCCMNDWIMTECWRSIHVYSNFQVSSCRRLGNVSHGRSLTGASTNGYSSVERKNVYGLRRFTYHWVVASDIVDNPYHKTHVDNVDHNNGNNRAYKWGCVTPSENHMNRTNASSNTSQNSGVSFSEAKQTWNANIMWNSVKHSLGTFTDEEAAAQAYDTKAVELFGEFAHKHVFPDVGLFLSADDR